MYIVKYSFWVFYYYIWFLIFIDWKLANSIFRRNRFEGELSCYGSSELNNRSYESSIRYLLSKQYISS